MTRAAHTEIRRLIRLYEGAELQLMLINQRLDLTTADEAKVRDLKQRQTQLRERIAWFEAILSEHEATAAQ
jgi:hypothetical protein